MPNRLTSTTLLLAACTLLSGCIYSREIARTRRDIERQYPDARFDRQVVLNLGPNTLGLVGWLADISDDEDAEQASAYLRDISRVKIGVYEVENLPELSGLELSKLGRLERQGWEVAVKAVEGNEAVWVLYREGGETIRDMYVFALDDEELVLVRIRGHLSRLLERAMQEDGLDWSGMVGN